jgi:hypothetical protein
MRHNLTWFGLAAMSFLILDFRFSIEQPQPPRPLDLGGSCFGPEIENQKSKIENGPARPGSGSSHLACGFRRR